CAPRMPRKSGALPCRSTAAGRPNSQPRRSNMKTVSVEDAIAMIPDGASVMVGGFMGVGTPERLVDELVRQRPHHLTIIANDKAMPGRGIGKLISAQLVGRTVAS